MQTFLRQRRYADVGFLLLLLLSLAVTWLALHRYGSDLEQNALSTHRQFVRTDARHIEANLSQTLNLLDLSLDSLLQRGYGQYTPAQWNAALLANLHNTPYLRSLSLLNGEGRIVASSNPRNIGRVPVFREFLPATASDAAALRIGTPWSGRDFDTGEAVADQGARSPYIGFIPVIRGRTTGGTAPQAVVAALNIDYFLGQIAQGLTSDTAWADVLRMDGQQLFSTRPASTGPREASVNAELAASWRAGNEFGTRDEQLADGLSVLTAWRLSDHYPVAVIVRQGRATALQDAQAEQQAYTFSLLPLMVGLLLVTTLSYLTFRHVGTRRMRQQLETRDRLNALLDSLPAMAVVVDDSGHITQCNRVWNECVEFAALPAGQAGIGAPCSGLSGLFVPMARDEPDLATGIDTILHREMAFYEGEFRLDTPRGPRWFHILVRNFELDGAAGAVMLALDITRHHEATERLRLDGRVFSASAEAIVITDADNHIMSVNPAFTRITGYTLDEVRGQNPSVLGSGEQSRGFYADLWNTLAAKGSWQGEIVNRNKAGELYPEWLSISLDRNADGEIRHYIGIFSDITAIKHTEQALRLSEERYRRTLAAVQDGMWSWRIDAGDIAWDARCYEMLGYTANEFSLTRERWLDMLHPEDRAITWPRVEAALRSDTQLHAELRLRSAQGLWFWVEVRGRVVDWEHEVPVQAVGTITDINERKATEQRLRLLDAAVKASPVAIMVTDTQAVIQSVNPAFCRLTGFPASDAIGHRPNELVRSGLQSRDFYEVLWSTILSGNTWHGELINRHRDGNFYHEELTIAPVRDEMGTLRNFVAIKQDITARKNAEAALIATRVRLAAVIASFQGAVIVEDEWRNVVLVNQTFCDTFGFDAHPDALAGHSWSDVATGHDFGAADPALFAAGIEVLLARRETALAEEVTMRDGRILERDYVPIRDGQVFLGHLRVYRDITEAKERERTLRRLATTDPLTGAYNRRHFMSQLGQELARHQRYDKPASLVMLDLDHFKRVNDTYGHAAGDAVLCHFTALTQQALRRVDSLGRLGGEEFAVLLPQTDLPGAMEFAERLRARIAASPVEFETHRIEYTSSLGVTVFAHDRRSEDVLARADAALYQAKDSGRNRVAVSPPPGDTPPSDAGESAA